jgi:protein involved in polysaccharide export with SLBB domain
MANARQPLPMAGSRDFRSGQQSLGDTAEQSIVIANVGFEPSKLRRGEDKNGKMKVYGVTHGDDYLWANDNDNTFYFRKHSKRASRNGVSEMVVHVNLTGMQCDKKETPLTLEREIAYAGPNYVRQVDKVTQFGRNISTVAYRGTRTVRNVMNATHIGPGDRLKIILPDMDPAVRAAQYKATNTNLANNPDAIVPLIVKETDNSLYEYLRFNVFQGFFDEMTTSQVKALLTKSSTAGASVDERKNARTAMTDKYNLRHLSLKYLEEVRSGSKEPQPVDDQVITAFRALILSVAIAANDLSKDTTLGKRFGDELADELKEIDGTTPKTELFATRALLTRLLGFTDKTKATEAGLLGDFVWPDKRVETNMFNYFCQAMHSALNDKDTLVIGTAVGYGEPDGTVLAVIGK